MTFENSPHSIRNAYANLAVREAEIAASLFHTGRDRDDDRVGYTQIAHSRQMSVTYALLAQMPVWMDIDPPTEAMLNPH